MDLSKISEIEFRITIIKLLIGLENSIKDYRESLSAELRYNQAKIKNNLTEMQSKWDAWTARVNESEERINDIEDKLTEMKEAEEKREKEQRSHEERLWEISEFEKNKHLYYWDSWSEREPEGTFEQIIAENFTNLGKEIGILPRRYRGSLPKSTEINWHPNI